MMIAPLVNSWYSLGILAKKIRLMTMGSTMAPMMAPNTLPVPPFRAMPPTTTAAMDFKVYDRPRRASPDAAWTVMAGSSFVKNQEEIKLKRRFLSAGEGALKKVLDSVEPDWEIKDISRIIQGELSRAGFFPVKSLTGHGIGRKLHEPPAIPCFYFEGMPSQKLKPGMVLAVEVIYSQARSRLKIAEDNWTVETGDGSLAALFEADIAIEEDKVRVLTPLSKFEN